MSYADKTDDRVRETKRELGGKKGIESRLQVACKTQNKNVDANSHNNIFLEIRM